MATWNSIPTITTEMVDEDFLLEVCGIRSFPESTNDDFQNSLSGPVRVELDGEKHIFRHAKEVQKGSRGGYLKGKCLCTISTVDQCDQIVRFIELWATF